MPQIRAIICYRLFAFRCEPTGIIFNVNFSPQLRLEGDISTYIKRITFIKYSKRARALDKWIKREKIDTFRLYVEWKEEQVDN